MARSRSGLGRGLGALIPDPEQTDFEGGTSVAREGGPAEVPLESIVPNPWQPRKSMSEDTLQELAASIRDHGIIQPLIVVRISSEDPLTGGVQYQLIAGERRWQAAKLAGLTSVPVVIKDAEPQEMLELALVENLQRADLNPLEEAQGYRQLMDEFGLTQKQVAARVGKSRAAVANAVRLLRLPDAIKTKLIDLEISEGQARALLALDDEDLQIEALEVVLKKGLNVRQTEELVRNIVRRKTSEVPTSPPTRALSPEEQALEDEFRQALGTKVQLVRGKAGSGRLVIQFYSEEELQTIYEILVRDS
jgi:ParB family chromosome partitioning protein